MRYPIAMHESEALADTSVIHLSSARRTHLEDLPEKLNRLAYGIKTGIVKLPAERHDDDHEIFMPRRVQYIIHRHAVVRRV